MYIYIFIQAQTVEIRMQTAVETLWKGSKICHKYLHTYDNFIPLL